MEISKFYCKLCRTLNIEKNRDFYFRNENEDILEKI